MGKSLKLSLPELPSEKGILDSLDFIIRKFDGIVIHDMLFDNRINRILIFVCFGLFAPNIVAGQITFRNGIKTGLVLGKTDYSSNRVLVLPGIPNCPGDNRNGTIKYNPSFLFGVTGELNLLSFLNIDGSMNYFKSSKESQTCSPLTYTNHWLNLDLMLKIHPNQKKINPYLVAGTRFRFLLNESYSIINFGKIYPAHFIDRISIDLVLGLGLEITNQFSIEIQNLSGLESVYRYFEPYEDEDIYYQNKDRFISVNFVYSFSKSQVNIPK